MNSQPLVSVAVITYNSSKTIVETLDSIYNQEYPTLELIISDDCSSDNTVDVCKVWIENHKGRFAWTDILTVEKNTGTSANLNRAEAACKGEWVKSIAGDDLLLPNCIQDFMDYAHTHPEALVIIGQTQIIGGDEKYRNMFYNLRKESFRQLSQMSHEELYERVMENNNISAPAVIFSKTLLEKYEKLNDEKIVFIEDWPRWMNLLRDGIYPRFLDKEVVAYRLGGVSTSSTWDSLPLFKDKRRIFFYYQWDHFFNKNREAVIEKTIEEECRLYEELLKAKKEVEEARASHAYKLGSCILAPFKRIKRWL